MYKINPPNFGNLISFLSLQLKFLSFPLKLTNRFTLILLFINFFFVAGIFSAYSQTFVQPNYYGSAQQSQNFMANSTAFKQEIARMEINVVRQNKEAKPITEVPRLQANDVLKVRLLEELVNGVKPDQSNYDWTFLVAYVNPGRNNDKEKSVSEEINFRKSGWYREYSFVVPYDSQPIFFIYPRPKYRAKVLNLINKNAEEIRKIGEKTIELAGAYAKIGSFLNELQFVLNGNYNGYGSSYGYGGGYGYGNGSSYGSSYSNYGNYNNQNQGYNYNLLAEQSVERLARSFSIQLPTCWQSGLGGYSSFGTTNTINYGVSQDMVSRMQCVSRNVRVEDLDLSVSKMLQQGGIMGVSQLSLKYPQISYWITIAAAALDFIIKANKKSPLKLVPTVIQANDYQSSTLINNYQPATSNITGSSSSPHQVKISLFAESQPNANDFVTAYPLVVHKWQANPDPEVIELPAPILGESCLHPGLNVLKNTDLTGNWMEDTFTQNFKLVVSSSNGFRKEFPLKKNAGMNGWELNITKDDLNSFPKIEMNVESTIIGTRGFNEIKSPKFALPLPVGGSWEISQQSQKDFAVGGKKTVTVTNKLGGCRCIQTIIYKPSFGGQFIFGSNNRENGIIYSNNGKEASIEVNTANFQAGKGQLELHQNGGEVSVLDINLYALPPSITNFKISRGDKQAVITGDRLEQLRAVKINGKRASVANLNDLKVLNNFGNNTTALPVQSNFSASGSTEKTVVFDDPNVRYDSNNIILELELEDNRYYSYPEEFKASPSRPSIVSNTSFEIDGSAVSEQSASPDTDKREKILPLSGDNKLQNNNKLQIVLDRLAVFPLETSKISVNVQNSLTDYDFKVENIQIETRVENSQVSQSELPRIDFEVLDWRNMRINFLLNNQSQKMLSGRRLQFRIVDKRRGNSDWYTIKQTFVRTPEISVVRCGSAISGNCELEGTGIEYISQISVDGGKSWNPQEPSKLAPTSMNDGKKIAIIPYYSDKKLLRIKLRDFSESEGLYVNNYNFINLKKIRKTN